MKSIIVLGAGPIGLAAAAAARARGHDVTVLERGEPCASLLAMGPTRFFTPFGMNVHSAMRPMLAKVPPDDALLTGPEIAALLGPAAQALGVRNGHRVVAIGRARLSKGDYAGHPLRTERSFRVLAEGPKGEAVFEADVVLDATGVQGTPTFIGAGGLPAVGERACASELVRDLGALERLRGHLAGRRALLVGHGHSAANAIGVLARIAKEAKDTRVTWAVRSQHARPVVEVADDPLPERREVAARANELAQRPPAWLTMMRRTHVEQIERGFTVTLTSGAVTCDHVIALTGWRPDSAHISELTVEIAPATDGAARLSRAISSLTDCLTPPRVTAADLESGEPGYFFVGARSYGRARTFLLETGYRQLDQVIAAL